MVYTDSQEDQDALLQKRIDEAKQQQDIVRIACSVCGHDKGFHASSEKGIPTYCYRCINIEVKWRDRKNIDGEFVKETYAEHTYCPCQMFKS